MSRQNEEKRDSSVQDTCVRNKESTSDEGEEDATESLPIFQKRKLPHFRFFRDQFDGLKSMDRSGRERVPNKESGTIPLPILEAIQDLEAGSGQSFFDVWCEAKLPNGEWVRCWPQYRKSLGSRYDWVNVSFDSDEDLLSDSEGEGSGTSLFPAKVLALYEDINGELKAIIQTVEYKTKNKSESSLGDTFLFEHHRLQFFPNGKPKMYAVSFESICQVILAFEAIKYKSPLPPVVREPATQRKHTVMVVLPHNRWAMGFIQWTRKLRYRQQMASHEKNNRLEY